MLFPLLASDPVPVFEGMDDDMGFSLPPVLAEEKEESEESAPRPLPMTLVCTHTNTCDKFVFCQYKLDV